MMFVLLMNVCFKFHSLFSLQGHNISYDLCAEVPDINIIVITNHIMCNKHVEVLHMWLY